MAERPPVVVSMNVEGFSGSESETHEIPGAEWDAMTPAARLKAVEELASDHAGNYVGWGWNIADPDDYASVGDAIAEASATRRVVEAATAYYWASGTPQETDAHNDLIDTVAALIKVGEGR